LLRSRKYWRPHGIDVVPQAAFWLRKSGSEAVLTRAGKRYRVLGLFQQLSCAFDGFRMLAHLSFGFAARQRANARVQFFRQLGNLAGDNGSAGTTPAAYPPQPPGMSAGAAEMMARSLAEQLFDLVP
jgi:hypothetical protein